jgi:hypothetical protein
MGSVREIVAGVREGHSAPARHLASTAHTTSTALTTLTTKKENVSMKIKHGPRFARSNRTAATAVAATVLAFAPLLLLAGGGCSGGGNVGTNPPPGNGAPQFTRNVSSVEGTVQYIPIEGGFYGIVTDGGEKFLPLAMDASLKQNGLRVRFSGKAADGYVTFYQWGTLVEISSIEKV